ncbi:MAG: CHAP domain-containing protein [Oscillospiraceae bacterium]|nr:CHAP domain-containing protein [Oscillospiraceae bacterium]
MKKKTIGIIAISVLCAFAIFAGAMFTHQYLDAKNSVEQFDELTDLIADVETGPETESPEESESTEEPELSEEELAAAQAALAHEKYGALFEQNQDFIGWIKIDGTKVDYPVMQSPNNPDYYLKHSFEKAYSDYGVPYIDEACATGISNNLVIYGHHMKNGTMFSDLCNYTDADFCKEHPIINFDTLSGFGEYQIVAVFKFDTNHEDFRYNEYTQMNEEQFKEFMNDISYRTETDTETEIIESDDGNGNILEETVEVTKTTLYITVSHKTAEQMSDQYRFNDDQDSQLEELLNVDNSMWLAVLYGIYGSDDMIVQVALSQIGNVGGEPYWSWYGFGSRVEWCACFVSWCADQCGYIENGIIPKYAGCVNGVNWFKQRNQWADNSIEPTPGMIIFFDWDNKGSSGPQDGLSDHTGIVERVENGIVYTVEGNTSDSCAERHYSVGYYEILGYGIPAY